MSSILGRKRNFLLIALVMAMLLPAAWAKGLDDFTLTKAIPADAFLAIHTRDHEGKDFIDKQFERVWAEVAKVRFDRDLKRMFKAMQQQNLPPDAEPEGFEEQWQQIYDLWTSVEWSSLGEREFGMGMKLGFPTIEFVMLMMPPQDKVTESFDGLGGVLKTIAELDPNALKLTTEEDDGTTIHKLAFADAPFPLGVTVARHEDVILIGFGPTMAEQSLALLRGQPGESLASTERFQNAFKKLPPPADQLTFFDIAKFMGQVKAMIAAGMAMTEAGAPVEGEPGYEEYVKWKALPDKIVHAMDMFEYSAAVKTTNGMLATTDAVTVLRDDAESHALYPVLFGNKPLSDPLKYVPASAGEFWATSGVDLPALYTAVVKIVREDVPDGEAMLAQLDALTKGPEAPAEPAAEGEEGTEQPAAPAVGIDIEKDIFGWIGGSLVTFTVPGKTPYSPSEFVLMLSVRDEAKAREMLDRLFGVLEPMLAQQQGSIVDAEIEGAEGFKSVVFPMLAMMGLNKPTLGVKDGWLFFGSSPDMIVAANDVASGKSENFSTNERFRKEGIPPEGNVVSLSFTDQTKLGEELGQALQMVPMIGMMAPDIMKNPVAQGLLSMAGKAGRVVRKLDFFQSSASRSTRDGKMIVTKSITTYREPPTLKKPTPMGTEGEGEPGEATEKPAEESSGEETPE